MIVAIPSQNLRAGMQTYILDPKGHPKPDVVLLKRFKTSPRFPHLAWEVRGGGKVVYGSCSKVLVRVEDTSTG